MTFWNKVDSSFGFLELSLTTSGWQRRRLPWSHLAQSLKLGYSKKSEPWSSFVPFKWPLNEACRMLPVEPKPYLGLLFPHESQLQSPLVGISVGFVALAIFQEHHCFTLCGGASWNLKDQGGLGPMFGPSNDPLMSWILAGQNDPSMFVKQSMEHGSFISIYRRQSY